MQALFDMDMSKNSSEERIELFCENFSPPVDVLPFFKGLFCGVKTNLKEIDSLIEKFSSNWKISRMSGVDRNILRIAVYEMLGRSDIPVKVAINEAIDIGKKYGTEDSGAFINGILDSIHLATASETLFICMPESAVPIPPLTVENPRPDPCDRSDPTPTFSPVKGKKGVVKRRGACGTGGATPEAVPDPVKE